MPDCDVVIVGAGLSGLAAAIELQSRKRSFCIIEASDRPGGRVRTDEVDGYLLDRGFQVLLTAYPECQHFFDYDKLRLKHFAPGARIYKNKKSFKISDPTRRPGELFNLLFSPVGSLFDKLKVLRYRSRVAGEPLNAIFKDEELEAAQALQGAYGFSDKMVDNFFRPFFSGIFLEKDLETSRRMLDFVFKMFSEGTAAIPERGMEQLPRQLAGKLPASSLHLNTKAVAIEEGVVHTEDGEQYKGEYVLMATQAPALKELTGFSCKVIYRSTTNMYFTADKPPYQDAYIALNASGSGLVNNVAVLSNVSAKYAPENKVLISVSVVGDEAFEKDNLLVIIQKELERMFGKEVNDWQHLKTYHIHYALPAQQHVQHEIAPAMMQIDDRTFICGDHLLNGSLNAALRSGRLVAELIADRLTT